MGGGTLGPPLLLSPGLVNIVVLSLPIIEAAAKAVLSCLPGAWSRTLTTMISLQVLQGLRKIRESLSAPVQRGPEAQDFKSEQEMQIPSFYLSSLST